MATDDQPEKDLGEIFDLDRKGLTAQLVTNMEQSLRDAQSAREDLKQVIASAKEAQFSRKDIKAMKDIARLKMKDQLTEAREQLAALERVGHAVGFDLFRWSEGQE